MNIEKVHVNAIIFITYNKRIKHDKNFRDKLNYSQASLF